MRNLNSTELESVYGGDGGKKKNRSVSKKSRSFSKKSRSRSGHKY